MKISQQDLLTELADITKDLHQRAGLFLQLDDQVLNWRENDDKWSILECLEHLNRYGDFYIPECRKRMKNYQTMSENFGHFKSGLLGNYFSGLMLPSEKTKKLESPKAMNPVFSQLDRQVVSVFLQQQKELLELLAEASKYNLNKVKTGITLTQWIKLKLGDTFRVVIYHNLRHVQQAEKILKLQQTHLSQVS